METIKTNTKETLSAEQSLKIIQETMERSRNAVTANAGNSYIAWGTAVAITALVIGHLWMHCGGPIWNWLWASIFITGPIGDKLLRKSNVPETASHIGGIIGKVWLAMGVFAGTIGFGTGIYCGLLNIGIPTDITATIIMLYGIATTITGFILKNKAITATGLIGGLGGYLGAIAVAHTAYGMVVLAAVAIISGVVPGIIIRFENKRSC